MPFFNAHSIIILFVILSSLSVIVPLVTGYGIHPLRPNRPTSALASKVIYQSPPMENFYKEFLVSSKPLTLRKYANGLKAKKTKKDSKIYYIPIPPLPYRYIPGVGYDYQPMKINPIMKETPALQVAPPLNALDTHAAGSSPSVVSVKPQSPYLPQLPFFSMPQTKLQTKQQHQKPIQSKLPVSMTARVDSVVSTVKPETGDNATNESKIYHMRRGNYNFNGRPFRLQVAHAHPKHQLTSKNLKSKFYFNKKFIF